MRPEVDEINCEHKPDPRHQQIVVGESVALLGERAEQIPGNKDDPEQDHAFIEHRSQSATQPGRAQFGRLDRFQGGSAQFVPKTR
jgi:hypothetical protein